MRQKRFKLSKMMIEGAEDTSNVIKIETGIR